MLRIDDAARRAASLAIAVARVGFHADSGVGSVRKLWLDGTIATIASGNWKPRGVASDGDRAFVSIRRGGRVLVIPI